MIHWPSPGGPGHSGPSHALRARFLSILSAVALSGLGVGAVEGQSPSDSVVAGVVVEARSQRPVAGAEVMVEGTDQRAVADGRGRFRIERVPREAVTLVVTMLGYRELRQDASTGDSNIRLALDPRAVELDDILVTGTPGGTERRAIGNAVSKIDAANVTDIAPIGSVGELLTGRAAGVIAGPSSGMVGGGHRIRIRGTASLSLSSDPIVYIDGVRVDTRMAGPSVQNHFLGSSADRTSEGFPIGAALSRINDVSPQDIESIEIVKGPAAATLYGTEASNGVIQIITKKGRFGERPRVDMTVRQGANWFMDPEGRMPTNYWRDPGTDEVVVANLVARETARGTPIFRTGHVQGYRLSVSGGTEDVTYHLGADYDHQQGSEPVNALSRLNGRANIGVSILPGLEVGASLGLTTSDTELPIEGLGGVWRGLSWATLADLDTPTRGFFNAPPEVRWSAHEASAHMDRFTGSIRIDHRLGGSWRQKLTLGLDVVGEDNDRILRNQALDPALAPFIVDFGSALGEKAASRSRISVGTLDYSGTLSVGLSEAFGSETSVGLQYYRKYESYSVATGQDFAAPGLKSLGATARVTVTDGSLENTTVGVYLQEQVSWRNRLFLTGAIRADDNSAFGEDFELVTYPKVSASWVVSEEPFWRTAFVSTLKLRFAYGETGQQPSAFAALRTYSPVVRGDGIPAVTPGSLGNPDLGPERGREVEAGFEAELLAGRVGLDLTYYHTRTQDAIVERAVPASGGFIGQQFVNIGELRSRGLELGLRASLVDAGPAAWDLDLNLATHDNEILDIGAGQTSLGGGRVQHVVGYPAYSLWSRRVVGAELDEEGVARNLLCDGGPELTHEPVSCAAAPEVFIGRTTPEFTGAVGTTLTLLDRLRLHALVDFQTGHKRINYDISNRCVVAANCEENVFPERFDPAYIAEVQAGFAYPEWIMSDASFAKLREVAVSYAIPEAWTQRFGASRASLTLAGRNLHTWTGWRGLDPEVGDLTSTNIQTPQLAQFLATLSLSF